MEGEQVGADLALLLSKFAAISGGGHQRRHRVEQARQSKDARSALDGICVPEKFVHLVSRQPECRRHRGQQCAGTVPLGGADPSVTNSPASDLDRRLHFADQSGFPQCRLGVFPMPR